MGVSKRLAHGNVERGACCVGCCACIVVLTGGRRRPLDPILGQHAHPCPPEGDSISFSPSPPPLIQLSPDCPAFLLLSRARPSSHNSPPPPLVLFDFYPPLYSFDNESRSSSGSGRGEAGNAHERLFGLHGEMLTNKQTKREVSGA